MTNKLWLLIFFALLVPNLALADWKIDRIYDGDTVYLTNDAYEKPFNRIGLRIEGIDTPENGKRAKCEEERKNGSMATLFINQVLYDAKQDGKPITFMFIKWGKYGGRVLGDILIDGKLYSAMAIKAGHARFYDGGKRKGWCD